MAKKPKAYYEGVQAALDSFKQPYTYTTFNTTTNGERLVIEGESTFFKESEVVRIIDLIYNRMAALLNN